MLIKTKSFTLDIYSKGNPDSKRLALVLPGKLDSKDYAHMRSHVNFLARLDYFALSFDPPGTWESPGNINLYTMTNYLKAIEETIEHFDNRPTFVVGHSRGGSMAMISASRNHHITSYASIMAGITEKSITSLTRKVSMRDLPPGGGEKVKKFDLPDSFYEDEAKYRLTAEIKNSKKPKLIIAGEHDQINSVEKVKDTFNKLLDPKVFLVIHSGHNYRIDPKKIEDVNKELKMFLEKYWKRT